MPVENEKMTLKEYLSKYKISMTEFAFRSGISIAALYNYKDGRRTPDQKMAEKIERETGGRVTVMQLRGKDERIKKDIADTSSE